MCAIGGEVSEIEELLGLMKEERENVREAKIAKGEKEENRENEKEQVGAEIKARATAWASQVSALDVVNVNTDEDDFVEKVGLSKYVESENVGPIGGGGRQVCKKRKTLGS